MSAAHAKWATGIFLAFILVPAGIALGLVAWARRDGVLAVHAALSEAQPWLLAWRLMLFATLMVFWREIIASLSRSFELPAASRAALMSWRWRAGTGLVLMDLVLAEDLLGVLQRVSA